MSMQTVRGTFSELQILCGVLLQGLGLALQHFTLLEDGSSALCVCTPSQETIFRGRTDPPTYT